VLARSRKSCNSSPSLCFDAPGGKARGNHAARRASTDDDLVEQTHSTLTQGVCGLALQSVTEGSTG
jgi:hypothetical protein